jgi:hypothetical protein
MRLPLSLAFLVAACGGTSVDIPDDGGGGGDATTNDGGGGGGDAAGGRDAASDAPITQNCGDLAKQLASAKADAQTCCPTCNSLQCTATVEDVCCPIAVESADKAQQFVALVQSYKTLCHPACPAIPCAAPLKQCDPNTSLCR